MAITRNAASTLLSEYLSKYPHLTLAYLVKEAKDVITRNIAKSHNVSFDDEEMLAYLYVAYAREHTWDKDVTTKITLYHGTPQKDFQPNPNYVNEETDYGSGLYLTQYKELAKEWSVAFHDNKYGYVHEFILDISDIQIFDFSQVQPVVWLAELAKHYKDDRLFTERQQKLIQALINKYSVYNTDKKDILYGWRADSSFSNIFIYSIQNRLSIMQINNALHIGDLNMQYCIKSLKAYSLLQKTKNVLTIEADEWKKKYAERISSFDSELEGILYTKPTGPSIIDLLED